MTCLKNSVERDVTITELCRKYKNTKQPRDMEVIELSGKRNPRDVARIKLSL